MAEPELVETTLIFEHHLVKTPDGSPLAGLVRALADLVEKLEAGEGDITQIIVAADTFSPRRAGTVVLRRPLPPELAD